MCPLGPLADPTVSPDVEASALRPRSDLQDHHGVPRDGPRFRRRTAAISRVGPRLVRGVLVPAHPTSAAQDGGARGSSVKKTGENQDSRSEIVVHAVFEVRQA